jgi:hypothetical protein
MRITITNLVSKSVALNEDSITSFLKKYENVAYLTLFNQNIRTNFEKILLKIK